MTEWAQGRAGPARDAAASGEERSRLPRSIAIDGPAGAGKSTIGRLLADRLGYLFLDTGAMYRVVALQALRDGIATTNEPLLAELAESLPMEIRLPTAAEADGRAYTVLVHGEDVTKAIRQHEVESVVSQIASWPNVRRAMVGQQRRMSRLGPVVMVGRDITTEVLPDADLKIYLDASIEERARRRFEELTAKGEHVTLDQVHSAIAHRDHLDMHREAGALRRAPDAITVHTDGCSIEQSLEKIYAIVLAWGEPA